MNTQGRALDARRFPHAAAYRLMSGRFQERFLRRTQFNGHDIPELIRRAVEYDLARQKAAAR